MISLKIKILHSYDKFKLLPPKAETTTKANPPSKIATWSPLKIYLNPNSIFKITNQSYSKPPKPTKPISSINQQKKTARWKIGFLRALFSLRIKFSIKKIRQTYFVKHQTKVSFLPESFHVENKIVIDKPLTVDNVKTDSSKDKKRKPSSTTSTNTPLSKDTSNRQISSQSMTN